MIYLLTQYMLI